jgi:hypothetical protein
MLKKIIRKKNKKFYLFFYFVLILFSFSTKKFIFAMDSSSSPKYEKYFNQNKFSNIITLDLINNLSSSSNYNQSKLNFDSTFKTKYPRLLLDSDLNKLIEKYNQMQNQSLELRLYSDSSFIKKQIEFKKQLENIILMKENEEEQRIAHNLRIKKKFYEKKNAQK